MLYSYKDNLFAAAFLQNDSLSSYQHLYFSNASFSINKPPTSITNNGHKFHQFFTLDSDTIITATNGYGASHCCFGRLEKGTLNIMITGKSKTTVIPRIDKPCFFFANAVYDKNKSGYMVSLKYKRDDLSRWDIFDNYNLLEVPSNYDPLDPLVKSDYCPIMKLQTVSSTSLVSNICFYSVDIPVSEATTIYPGSISITKEKKMIAQNFIENPNYNTEFCGGIAIAKGQIVEGSKAAIYKTGNIEASEFIEY